MEIVRILIYLIAAVAVGCIVWWFLSSVALPWPLQVAVYAILAIVAILVVVRLVDRGAP
jgi:membrane protein implicated in regulation of membrane protease activity